MAERASSKGGLVKGRKTQKSTNLPGHTRSCQQQRTSQSFVSRSINNFKPINLKHIKINELNLKKLNCETDFVARNEKFLEISSLLAMSVVKNAPLTDSKVNPVDFGHLFHFVISK